MGLLEEVVVTARRREETLQDVPLTVNVVDDEALQDLNIRRLEDVETMVAGLTMEEDAIAPNASVRGVRFDSFASGNNPTIEFYMNDAPIVASSAMEATFDVGQIEVLRGPQGTLRGRASPSGSITITTKRPDLQNLGGYVDVTATDNDGQNVRAAFNLPVVQDVLGLRLAGFVEENDGNDVESIYGGSSEYESDGYRVSLRYEPADNLLVDLMYQEMEPERTVFSQVESASIANPDLGSGPIAISDDDRLSVSNIPSTATRELERTGLEVEWGLGDLQLNYAGSITDERLDRKASDDSGDFFDESYPEPLQNLGQELIILAESESHELRLSGSYDSFDFVVGAMVLDFETNNEVSQQTPVFAFFANPATFAQVAETPIDTHGESTEESVFGNVTFHLTQDTELSAGLRHIQFETQSNVDVSGNTISDVDEEWDETIYLLSLKHHLNEDLMAYATVGSSWRPGINTVGNFNTQRTARETSFIELEPETSDSVELGMKSNWLDNRLRANLAAFYQEFDNYPYRAAGSGVYYVSTDRTGLESVETFNFVAAVPVEVYGIELETFYQATANWDMSALFSWSRGEIDNGTIPCNVYGGQVPTIGEIRAAADGDNVASCQADFQASYAPLWTTTLQSEYRIPMGEMEGYVRGLASIYGDSDNDPSNPLDDVDSYSIFNLYAGLRDINDTWSVMFYGKNLFETERVLSRSETPASVGYTVLTSLPPNVTTQSASGVTDYRAITMTRPREFGVNFRYDF